MTKYGRIVGFVMAVLRLTLNVGTGAHRRAQ